MEAGSWEKARRADKRVSRCLSSLGVALEGLPDIRKRQVEHAARTLGTAVASLCIEVERATEAERASQHTGEGD